WHFAPSLTMVSARGGRTVLADGTWRVTLLQFTTPSCRPLDGQTIRTGSISTGYLKRAEAVTVLSPPAASMLTVIVPGTGDPEVSYSGGQVTVRTPAGPVSFPLSLDPPHGAVPPAERPPETPDTSGHPCFSARFL
ncbi:hypothetical protein, partial [Micromonospora harpali]